MAGCENGDITGFESVVTPTEPEEFFDWMARKLLDASHEGRQWLVTGFPGPVSPDGNEVGPLVNVAGMREERYDLRERLTDADPEVERVLDQGFTLLAVNDGTLAAQAAASRIGLHRYDKTGALIVGTGVGAGVVERDPDYTDVHRPDTKNPLEIGHLMLDHSPGNTFESRYSGPGMEREYGVSPEDLPADHHAWPAEGTAISRLALTLGLMNGVELVVPTGGVGAGASDKLEPHVRASISSIGELGNGPQKMFAPDVMFVPPGESGEFELYGAEGVMRDHMTSD
jgi:predicted NBD/HSP70 family sugar kinase